MSLFALALIVFCVNLPFGVWRSYLRKFSWQWFVSIHASVPLVVALRLWAGFDWTVIPFLVIAFFAGQFVGVRVGRRFA